MRAMSRAAIAPLEENRSPLTLVDVLRPTPGKNEILIRVSVCGVCHTEIDEIEGRTPPSALPGIPGHEVVGTVERTGAGVSTHKPGDRVGVVWIYASDGSLNENLSDAFRATGRDANGGYADYMVVPEDYAYRVPAVFFDEEPARLLCAGGVGFRALNMCHLENGQRLGLTGFGGSGHLVLQLAMYLYPDSEIFVSARSKRERQFALELGLRGPETPVMCHRRVCMQSSIRHPRGLPYWLHSKP